MSYVGGIAVALLAVGPIVAGTVAARRRWFPTWRGADARVVEIVTALAALTVTAELLGVVGLFRRWVVVAGCVAVGAAMVLLATRARPPAVDTEAEADEGGSVLAEWSKRTNVLVALAGGIVAIQWLAASVHNLRVGMQNSIDTLWYHGPMAANFVQDASITRIHYFDDNPITAFFPGGSEILHALGILFVGDDILSPLLNLVFLTLAVLAAWSIGRSLGSAPASALGALVVLGTPVFVEQQPGGGYNDIIGLALVLAVIALLLRGNARGPALAFAGIAAGLAVGTKSTMLAPIGALALGVVLVAGRGRRWKAFATLAVTIGAVGGVWFVRNAIETGNPLPGLSLSLGPLNLAELPTSTPIDRVANYLTDGNIIRHIFIPGWSKTMGPGWWATLTIGVLAGVFVAFRGRAVIVRVVGAAAVVTFGAFVLQPQYMGIHGLPTLFHTNTRYSFVALAMGLVVLPSLAVLRSRTGSRVLVVGLLTIFVLTQVRVSQLWSPPAQDIAIAVLLLAGGVGAFLICVRIRHTSPTRRFAVVVATALLAAIGVVWVIQRDVRTNRYHDAYNNADVLAILRDKRDIRIAEVGYVSKYPLYGPDLSNRVVWIGRRGENGSFRSFASCVPWKQFLNRGDYDYVLIGGKIPGGDPRRYFTWALADSALHPVALEGLDAITFRVDDELDPSTCP